MMGLSTSHIHIISRYGQRCEDCPESSSFCHGSELGIAHVDVVGTLFYNLGRSV
jgi:hypothetical protein